jgi:hypothetical protein
LRHISSGFGLGDTLKLALAAQVGLELGEAMWQPSPGR